MGNIAELLLCESKKFIGKMQVQILAEINEKRSEKCEGKCTE